MKLCITILNKIISLQIDTSWQDHDLWNKLNNTNGWWSRFSDCQIKMEMKKLKISLKLEMN
jgi:hypothetical protein